MKNSSQWKYNLFLWNASIFHSVDSEWLLNWSSHSCSALLWPCSCYQNNKIHTCWLGEHLQMLCKYSTHEETLCYSKSNTDLVSEYYLQSPDLNSSILQSEWWPWGRKHTPTITWSSKGQKNSSFLLQGYFQRSLRGSWRWAWFLSSLRNPWQRSWEAPWGPCLGSQLGVTHTLGSAWVDNHLPLLSA